MDIFSLVGKITINYADAVNNIEKVSKSAKDTAETLEEVDKKADGAGDSVEDAGQAAKKCRQWIYDMESHACEFSIYSNHKK